MESGRARGNYTFRIFGLRFGFEHSPIYHGGSLYMDRWLLYVFGCTLRLHHIMRPDHDRALHNHPFWFVTLPLGSYREEYWAPESRMVHVRDVRPFVPQYRGIDFRHRICLFPHGPVWTIVVTGRYRQKWGFFPKPDEFIPRDATNAKEPLL